MKRIDPFRVIVTGSRAWANPRLVFAALRAVESEALERGCSEVILVEGGCPTGADTIARRFLEARQQAAHRPRWTLETFHAAWDYCDDQREPRCPPYGHRQRKRPGDIHHPGQLPDYCPRSGPRRNRAMIEEGADLCLAFIRNHSRGTTGCAEMAKLRGIETQTVLDCSCHAGLVAS